MSKNYYDKTSQKGDKAVKGIKERTAFSCCWRSGFIEGNGPKREAFSRGRQEQVRRNKTIKWKVRTPKGQREMFYFEDELERFFRIQFTFFGAEPWQLFEKVNGRVVENWVTIGRAETAFARRVGKAVSVMYSHIPVEDRARFLNQAYHFFEKFKFGDQREYVFELLEVSPVMEIANLPADPGYRVLSKIMGAGAEEAMARCLSLHSELPKMQRNNYQIGPYQYGLMSYFFPELMGLSQLFHGSKFRLFSESRDGMVVNKKRAAEFRAEAVERFAEKFEFALLHTPGRDREHFLRGIINLANTIKTTGRKTAKSIPAMKKALKEEGTDHWWDEEFISMLWDEVSAELKKRARTELRKLKSKKK